jgi:hypothetical protein
MASTPARRPGVTLRSIRVAATIFLAGTLAPSAALADEAGGGGKPVCLDVNRIDHTEVLSDHQILFHMYGEKTWVNTLASRCSTLTRQDGFVWVSRLPKYCDNVETIRVIRTGEVCMLGAFTPYGKPRKAS